MKARICSCSAFMANFCISRTVNRLIQDLPDANRTQPFGSGATCFYPHGDLMITNRTGAVFQLSVSVGRDNLHAAWHADVRPACCYEIIARDHMIKANGGAATAGTTRCTAADLI